MWIAMMVLGVAIGLWLLLGPRKIIGLWTGNRVPISRLEAFFVQLTGLVIIWILVFQMLQKLTQPGIRAVVDPLWALTAVAAVALLGYHLGKHSLSKGRSEIDSEIISEAARNIGETHEAEKVRYKLAWRRYRRLRLEFPLSIPGWFVFSFLLSGMFRLFGWDQKIAMVFILAYIPYVSVVAWQWSYWRCPRCGYAFKGKYDLFFPKNCHHCGLPLWAESSDE